jgi:demethylmenaquinone methyltransferase/2-methoxy-6-polyprenyl-1,4-benzoquinol methylase
MRLLDVAGGTGDIAFRFLERAGGAARGASVLVCDINETMLSVGRDRGIDRGILDGIDWITGDAERLPIADASVDAYTIAFGIRNVTELALALAEARRVLRPGGHFLCLEFSHVVLPGLERLYDAYSFSILPWLGSLVAGDADSYRYLAESIRRFPDQARFAAMIEAAGLGQVRYRNLSGGIAAIHSAWRI